VDILDTLAIALAPPPPHPGAADSREHVELPLDVPPDAPRRAPRDERLWRIARRARGAALQVELELRTSLATQVFRRDFVYVSRLLHALEASRRVQGLDTAFLDDTLAALRRRADDADAQLDRIGADLQARVALPGLPDAPITFARPARLQATVVTPSAHRYLALLLHADATLAQLERAWLLGAVDPATRTALASDCRRALQGYKQLAGDRRAAVGEHVRQVNARRRRGGTGDGDG
jgi:hypothetical protein